MAQKKKQKVVAESDVAVVEAREPFDISPKVVIPVLGQLLVVLGLWVATGEFNKEEVLVSFTALVNALLGYQTEETVVVEEKV